MAAKRSTIESGVMDCPTSELATIEEKKVGQKHKAQLAEASTSEAFAIMRKLKPTEYRFVLHYLDTLSPERAAMLAGIPNCNDKLAYKKAGLKMLRRINVREALNAFADSYAAPTQALVARLSSQASADITDIADCFDDIEGKRVLNLEKVREKNLGHIIKRITPTKHGDVVELVDSQRAIELIGKFRGDLKQEVKLGVGLENLSDKQLEAIIAGKITSI